MTFDEGTKFDPNNVTELIALDSFTAVPELVSAGLLEDIIDGQRGADEDDEVADNTQDTIEVVRTQAQVRRTQEGNYAESGN